MTEPHEPRQYWAFLANPEFYRIEEAVHDLATNLWIVPSHDVKIGDRVLIWKAKGRSTRRGVVALAEVIEGPAVAPDEPQAMPYWIEPGRGLLPSRRVRLRYLKASRMPLWEGESGSEVLSELSVSRATGGSIFKVLPDQWVRLLQALGEWPGSVSTVAGAHERDDSGDLRQLPSGLAVRVVPTGRQNSLQIFSGTTLLGEYERAADHQVERLLGEIDQFAEQLMSAYADHGPIEVRRTTRLRGKEVRDRLGNVIAFLKDSTPARRNPAWDRQELILALDLYMKLRGTSPGKNHPEVVALSELLRDLRIVGDAQRADPERFRNPSGVVMKLMNLRRLDPSYQGSGLKGGGQLEEAIWHEFADNTAKLAAVAASIREDVEVGKKVANLDSEVMVQIAKRPARRVQAQGFARPEDRKAVELYAMHCARVYFEERGYSVEDVSANSPFDLLANRAGDQLHIEVKGTRSLGEKVFLTDGEVRFAREHRHSMVLFVVHSLLLRREEGNPVIYAGETAITWPWDIDAGTLAPLSYSYVVPQQASVVRIR